ncbi:60S ribosomal protein L31-like [Microtus oregoni]|uniref:60S ribosomal protein L31-like n=1 Tax=Microtus oregoni TaxID=111838 RepID=UPI001BB1A189|nr:60S ribosomal protein L31-like [Microtus oregoni]
MTPTKRGVERGPSALNEVVIQEHTINIHKHIHGVSFKKRASQALREIQKFSMKETGPPVHLFRNCNEDEDSPNKLYTLVTYLSVTTFKTPQRVNVDEN